MANVDGENNQVHDNVNAPNAIPQVARVGVKIPPIWKNNIKLWFIQVESNFSLAGITQDSTKYNTLVAALDTECLTSVSDILFTPPENNKYEALKTRLTNDFSDSETKRVQKLLSALHLGDQKPSMLLRQMRGLANGALNDEFLRNLWMQRLPLEIQSILSVSSETLDSLALLADKISEVRSDPNSINAVGQSATPYPSKINLDTNACASIQSTSNEISALKEQVRNLSEQIERLSRQQNRGHNHRRRFSKSPFRGNNNRRRNPPNESSGLCYYHANYGKKARNCEQPCNYSDTGRESEN